jgi:HK97 gp10 family phage protein
MGVKLDGMQNLLDEIARLNKSIEGDLKEKALSSGAEFLQEKIKEQAPVRTGRLKRGITFSDIQDDSVFVGPSFKDAFYGYFLEFGTSKSAAKPFLQPAFDNHKEEVQEKMAEVIKRELNL